MGKILGVIPAHLDSTRLRRKLLAPICGHPMILWVYRRARQASCLDDLLVATDSEEILEFCRRNGVPAAMTSPQHRSGSDRIFEVVERSLMSGDGDDIYVNIQGDEPMILPEHLDLLVRPLHLPATAGNIQVSTLKVPISPEEARDPSNVKVVTDMAGRALYFSRAIIPYDRDRSGEAQYHKHLGLYAYTAEAVRRFHSLPPSALELSEKLEQLRFLENGIPVYVSETLHDTIGVDTADDLRKVEEYFRREGIVLPGK
jgi:3-deoxy-manno-octulosonate cytidylyltransferase (CMP-KDO synthetase)